MSNNKLSIDSFKLYLNHDEIQINNDNNSLDYLDNVNTNDIYKLNLSNLDINDANGYTPLCFAAANNVSPEIIVGLINLNANPNLQCDRGITPLNAAITSMNFNAVKALLGDPITYNRTLHNGNYISYIKSSVQNNELVEEQLYRTSTIQANYVHEDAIQVNDTHRDSSSVDTSGEYISDLDIGRPINFNTCIATPKDLLLASALPNGGEIVNSIINNLPNSVSKIEDSHKNTALILACDCQSYDSAAYILTSVAKSDDEYFDYIKSTNEDNLSAIDVALNHNDNGLIKRLIFTRSKIEITTTTKSSIADLVLNKYVKDSTDSISDNIIVTALYAQENDLPKYINSQSKLIKFVDSHINAIYRDFEYYNDENSTSKLVVEYLSKNYKNEYLDDYIKCISVNIISYLYDQQQLENKDFNDICIDNTEGIDKILEVLSYKPFHVESDRYKDNLTEIYLNYSVYYSLIQLIIKNNITLNNEDWTHIDSKNELVNYLSSNQSNLDLISKFITYKCGNILIKLIFNFTNLLTSKDHWSLLDESDYAVELITNNYSSRLINSLLDNNCTHILDRIILTNPSKLSSSDWQLLDSKFVNHITSYSNENISRILSLLVTYNCNNILNKLLSTSTLSQQDLLLIYNSKSSLILNLISSDQINNSIWQNINDQYLFDTNMSAFVADCMSYRKQSDSQPITKNFNYIIKKPLYNLINRLYQSRLLSNFEINYIKQDDDLDNNKLLPDLRH